MAVSSLQPNRYCSNCEVKLSRYNQDLFCWSCREEQQKNRTQTELPSLPLRSFAHQSAFALRSILDTVRRTQPIHLSDVGHVLRQYRNLHHLTQRDLARFLGFDQSYISKLENGQSVRDIATLKRIAQSLDLPGQWLGLIVDSNGSMVNTELVEVAPSLIRLSQTAREAGRADAAVNELWPLILRLEAHLAQDQRNVPLLLTLASAQATLGVILGDLLPEESLWISVHFFKRAVNIVNEQGDAFMKAEIYRGYGNELRKHNQYTEAIPYLEQALSLAPDITAKGLAAALLARTFGEMRDWENFRDTMQTALYYQEKTPSFTPTFNPIMLQEIQIRGFLSIGRFFDIPTLLQQDEMQTFSVSIAPQWNVISHLTKAEAQFQVGNVDDGLINLKKSLIGAEICKLPHQIQRAIRVVRVVHSYTPAKETEIEAQLLLKKLSQQTLQLPVSQ